jgi:hypothetical protein
VSARLTANDFADWRQVFNRLAVFEVISKTGGKSCWPRRPRWRLAIFNNDRKRAHRLRIVRLRFRFCSPPRKRPIFVKVDIVACAQRRRLRKLARPKTAGAKQTTNGFHFARQCTAESPRKKNNGRRSFRSLPHQPHSASPKLFRPLLPVIFRDR